MVSEPVVIHNQLPLQLAKVKPMVKLAYRLPLQSAKLVPIIQPLLATTVAQPELTTATLAY